MEEVKNKTLVERLRISVGDGFSWPMEVLATVYDGQITITKSQYKSARTRLRLAPDVPLRVCQSSPQITVTVYDGLLPWLTLD